MKKTLAIMLTAVIIVTIFAACGAPQSSSAPASQASQSANAAASNSSSIDVSQVPSEPVKIRVFNATHREEDEHNAPVKQYLLDELGIDFEYILAPTAEGPTRFALLLSSGERMDMMYLSPLLYQQYALQGGFRDISGEYQAYPNLMQYIGEEGFERIKVNGGIYGVPRLNLEGKYNTYLRADWLDNLGMSVPVTLDDFHEVMRAFTTKDPDGNGQNDTYAYTGRNLTPFFGAFGVMGTYSNDGGSEQFPSYYTLKDGKVSANAISEEYKQALMFVKDAYDEGLIDPEAFIIASEQISQKYVNNRVGSYTAWWSAVSSNLYRNYEMETLNPDANIIALDPPVGPTGQSGLAGQNVVEMVIAIGRETEVLSDCLRFLDWNLSDYGWQTVGWGIEGLHWERDANGKLAHIAALNQTNLLGETITTPANMEFYQMLIRWDIYPERYINDDMVSVKAKENLIRSGEVATISNLFVGMSTEATQTYLADLVKYEQEQQLAFVLGDESFDNWDKYVETWKSLGGEEVRQSLLEAYNSQYGTNYTFAE